jgi:hypothetical protein
MFVDNPLPGVGLVAAVLACLAAFWLGAWLCPDVPLCRYVAWLATFHAFLALHTFFHTEYVIADGTLKMKAGWFCRIVLPLGGIHSVERAERITRLVGRGPRRAHVFKRGCANRLSNGLCLHTESGDVYVSPTDTEAFKAAIWDPDVT